MQIKKIYIDMDGVLSDFDKGAKELCGLEPRYQSVVIGTAEDAAWWAKVRAVDHFYDKLDLITGSKEMFDELYGKYGDAVEILSAIPKPHRGIVSAKEDKINWVRRLLSEDVVINIVFREEKAGFCTGKDCILIDDYDKNIKEWEFMGGTGILFINANDVISSIENLSRC